MVKEKKKLRCIKYFRTFVDKGKDMNTVFEKLKKARKRRRCKGRKCRNRESKSKPKSKPKSKSKSKTKRTRKPKLMGGQLPTKRHCNGRRCRKPKSKQKPRFRSTKNVNSAHMNPFHNQQKPRFQGIALIQLIYKIKVIVMCFQLMAHSL